MTAKRILALIIHATAVGVYLTSFRMMLSVPLIREDLEGSHFQYLTNLGLTSTLITQSFGLAETLSGMAGYKKLELQLDTFKLVSSYVSAPIEFVIGIMFWSLFAINPDLLIDPNRIHKFPTWLNYCVHLYPMLFELGNLALSTTPWTITLFSQLSLSVALSSGYFYWIKYTTAMYGFYPYPFLKSLQTSHWIALYLVGTSIAVLSAVSLKRIQSLVLRRAWLFESKEKAE